MKNILIVLGLTIALGVAGFMGTAVVAQKMQQPQAETQRQAARSADEEMYRSSQRLGSAVEGLQKRQEYAMVGGGVGAGMGLLGGIVVARRREKKVG